MIMRRRPKADRRDGIAPNGKPFESVWDFPRPPLFQHVEWRIRVIHAGVTIVDAPRALRVLETSQPPAYYVAPEFVDVSAFVSSATRTLCEWKGLATYASVDLAGVDTGKIDRRVRGQALPFTQRPIGRPHKRRVVHEF